MSELGGKANTRIRAEQLGHQLDGVIDPKVLSELVKKDGFNTSYREIPGRHYWFLWRDFLVQYAQIAFQPQPKS